LVFRDMIGSFRRPFQLTQAYVAIPVLKWSLLQRCRHYHGLGSQCWSWHLPRRPTTTPIIGRPRSGMDYRSVWISL